MQWRLIASIVLSRHFWTMESHPEAAATTFVTSAHILSKHAVWSLAKRPIVALMYRPYSKVIILRKAASVDVRLALDPHCSLWRSPAASAMPMRLRAMRIFRAVLKSASSMPIMRSWWMRRTPRFFSSITSTIFVHRLFENPYMNGRLIMVESHSAMSSSRAKHFHME